MNFMIGQMTLSNPFTASLWSRFDPTKTKLTCILAALFMMMPSQVHSTETYAIDGSALFLYKVINWWYDCLPQESHEMCGHRITYEKTESCRVEYNEPESTVTLHIEGKFAGLLSVFSQNGQDFSPGSLTCTWLNETYFGNGRPGLAPSPLSETGPFTITRIPRFYAQKIQQIEKDIRFVLEGRIGGLLNGKIALYRQGEFLKRCPNSSDAITDQNDANHHLNHHLNDDRIRDQIGDRFPVTLKIVDSGSQSVLAEYTAVWKNADQNPQQPAGGRITRP